MPETNLLSPGLGEACPFLASRADPASSFSFATGENYCYKVKQPRPVALGYQQDFCLSSQHVKCRVYLEKNPAALPKNLRGETFAPRTRLPVLLIGGLLVAALALLLFLVPRFAPLVFGDRGLPQTQTALAVFVSQGSPTPSPSQSGPSSTPSLAFSQTAIPSSTISPRPTSGPGLTTPFGPNNDFVLHQIQDGQSMGWLMEQYNTTVEVLRQLNNYPEGQPLITGQIWVVIPGQREADGLAKYEAIQIQEPSSVMDLAISYGVTENELRRINSLGAADLLPAGRWLIFPVGEGG